MQLIIGLVVAGAVFVVLRLMGGSRRTAVPPNIVYARGSSGATQAPPGGPAPSPVPPGGGYVTTPAGEAFVQEGLSQEEVDNLAQYGTTWGKGQPPSWYTFDNLFGAGSTFGRIGDAPGARSGGGSGPAYNFTSGGSGLSFKK